MAMNATQVSMNVKGVNKTGKVFKEIAASAAHVAKTSAMIGGAAFGGAAVAFAATTKSLASLGDSAMRAGASASELSKLSNTLDYLGIKSSSPDELASAFQNMTKSIGESGVEGFQRAIKSIAQLETASDRSKAAMEVFGQSGMNFLPLIEAAARGSESAFNDVMNATPGVSEAAIKAAGEVDAAMKTMTQGSKALWSNAIGEIARLFDAQFSGGIREAALKANAYMEFAAKVGWKYAKTFFQSWAQAEEGIVGGFKNALDNMLAMAGGFVVAVFKSVAAPLRKAFESAANGWIYMYKRVFEGKESAEQFVDAALSVGGTVADYMKEPWEDLAKFVKDDLQWFPDGTSIDISGLRKNLEEQLAASVQAAAAAGSAAVSNTVTNSANETASNVGNALKSIKMPWMEENSYKAATMSMRADYGQASDGTVKAVDKVRAVNEQMKTVLEKISSSIDAIPVV